jgi:hypothetical protein
MNKETISKWLKCKRCEYTWKYTGKSKFYTSCPQCRNSNVDINKHIGHAPRENVGANVNINEPVTKLAN